MLKIQAKPEGREGVYVVQPEIMAAWLAQYPDEMLHNYLPSRGVMFGADWEKQSVIDEVLRAERIAVLTGAAALNNVRHALAVVVENELKIFDIGTITDADIDLTP